MFRDSFAPLSCAWSFFFFFCDLCFFHLHLWGNWKFRKLGYNRNPSKFPHKHEDWVANVRGKGLPLLSLVRETACNGAQSRMLRLDVLGSNRLHHQHWVLCGLKPSLPRIYKLWEEGLLSAWLTSRDGPWLCTDRMDDLGMSFSHNILLSVLWIKLLEPWGVVFLLKSEFCCYRYLNRKDSMIQ